MKNYKEQAEFLWNLLDDIDTAGDMFKPKDLDSWERYNFWINKKLQQRFKIFQSDGHNLLTPEEYQKQKDEVINRLLKKIKDSGFIQIT